MSFFRKAKNEAGEEIFEEVDLATVELPEAAVKAQKAFKDVLTESIGRRQEIADLKAKKTSEESEEPVVVKKPVTEEVVTKTPVVDPDALFTDFEARLEKKRTDAAALAQTEKEGIAAIIKEFGLKQDAVGILEDSKNPRAAAEKLAKVGYRFDEQSSGDPAKKQIDDAVGAAFKKLKLED